VAFRERPSLWVDILLWHSFTVTIIIDHVHVKVWLVRLVDDGLNYMYNSD
jgi:hypothetical protein